MFLVLKKKKGEWKDGGKTYEEEPKRPKDWKFMEQSKEVLADIPDTWKQYPHTKDGLTDIIRMEFDELMKAGDKKDVCHELVHLASACLYLWRYLNDAE